MLKKMKNNKKGFTLVELIVVLVILAILAALLIPALTGYIDRAKKKSIIAETRQVVMAAQTLVDEAYAKDQATAITIVKDDNNETSTTAGAITTGAIKKLAEVKGNITVATTSVSDGKVVDITYSNGGKTCQYKPANSSSNSDGDYNVTATTTSTTGK